MRHLWNSNILCSLFSLKSLKSIAISLLEVNNSALVLEELKTISLLRRLFDNYELHTHIPENITAAKEQEQIDFLKAILATPHMQKTIEYLENRGKKIYPQLYIRAEEIFSL